MLTELAHGFTGEVNQYSIDTNFTWASIIFKVLTQAEIVLINNWPTIQPFRAKHEVERFTDGRLAHIVTADEQGVVIEPNTADANTSKVLYVELAYFHDSRPRFRV